MRLKGLAVVSSSLCAAAILLSCSTPPTASSRDVSTKPALAEQASLADIYSGYAKAGGKVLRINPDASAVRIYAFRAGRAANLGHNHVLSAPQFTGYVFLPTSGIANARFDLAFRLDQLEIDNPDYRKSLGPAFASLLSPEAISGTREHMLGMDNLQAEKFPFVHIHSLLVAGEAPKLAVKIGIEMHGQENQMWIPLNVDGLPEHASITGSFVLKQSDFGAKPYSVLGGLLAVQDEVVVEFRLSDQ